jgi:hypothetical protein
VRPADGRALGFSLVSSLASQARISLWAPTPVHD